MSIESQRHLLRSPELLTEQQQFQLLSAVGNHEAKLLTAAVIASSPDRSFRPSTLYNELVDRQGDFAGWKPARSAAWQYCEHSLEPIGAVVRQTVFGHKGPTSAYVATELGSQWVLPLAGTLLDWSLQNPDHSLIPILGGTVSPSGIRSPEVRFGIYQALVELSEEQQGASYRHLASSIANDRLHDDLITEQIRDMLSLGVLKGVSLKAQYNPGVEIIDPNFRHLTYGFESLLPETKAIYSAMETMYGAGSASTDLDALVSEITKQPGNASLDPYSIRLSILKGISPGSTNYPGLRLTLREIPLDQQTSIWLDPELASPITDLVKRVESLFAGQNIEALTSRALEIITNPKDFAALMAKVERFSPQVASHTEGRESLNQRIISIIGKLGTVSLKDIQAELSTQGRRMTVDGIRTALEPLVEAGSLSLSKRPASDIRRNMINIYRLPEDE